MGFTTTNDGSWSFEFGEMNEKPKLRENMEQEESYMADADRWANFCDPILYECDSLIRQYLNIKQQDNKWKYNANRKKYNFRKMFRVLFGREYDRKTDLKYSYRLPKIMAYYSSKITNQGQIDGKQCKKVYTMSTSRLNKMPPYSLKLRLEWLGEKGDIPTWSNMAVPKDDLEPGHARNYKTEKNMERRREQARARYNERYNRKKGL